MYLEKQGTDCFILSILSDTPGV